MTETELRLQYADRTLDINYPERIEQVLEDYYVRHSEIYTDEFRKEAVKQVIEH